MFLRVKNEDYVKENRHFAGKKILRFLLAGFQNWGMFQS
jgi:hypothetical protein